MSVNYVLLFWSAVDLEIITCFIHEMRFPRKFIKYFLQISYKWPKIYCNLCELLEILEAAYVAPNCVGVMQSLDLRTGPTPMYVTGNLVPLSFNFILGEMTLTLAGTVKGYEVCLLSICV